MDLKDLPAIVAIYIEQQNKKQDSYLTWKRLDNCNTKTLVSTWRNQRAVNDQQIVANPLPSYRRKNHKQRQRDLQRKLDYQQRMANKQGDNPRDSADPHQRIEVFHPPGDSADNEMSDNGINSTSLPQTDIVNDESVAKTTVPENKAVNKQNLGHEIEAQARKRCIPESEMDHHFSKHDDHTTTRNMSCSGPMNVLVHQQYKFHSNIQKYPSCIISCHP